MGDREQGMQMQEDAMGFYGHGRHINCNVCTVIRPLVQ